jgi:hypothetical protein
LTAQHGAGYRYTGATVDPWIRRLACSPLALAPDLSNPVMLDLLTGRIASRHATHLLFSGSGCLDVVGEVRALEARIRQVVG